MRTRGFLLYIATIILTFIVISSIILPLTMQGEKITVIIVLAILFIVIFYLGYHAYHAYIKPLQMIQRNINAINAQGQLEDISSFNQGVISEINEGLFTIDAAIRTSAKLSKQNNLLYRTAIDNMESGLVFIDEKGYVNLVNQQVYDMLDIPKHALNHTLYYHFFNQEDTINVIQKVFLNEAKVEKVFKTSVLQQQTYFEVIGLPLMNRRHSLKGIIVVIHDITKFKLVEKMRRDFVANVSHELKTPVTSIRGFAETLIDKELKDLETRQAFLEIILKESLRLETLVNELLELSKIEATEQGIEMDYYPFSDITRELYQEVQQQLNSKRLNLEFDVNEDLIIFANKFRLKQALNNLIYNAINYSYDDANILLKAQKYQDYIIIQVKDEGIGIDEEKHERIFERFYRIDKARSRNTGGTGLGLAIVKHIIEAHHGKIKVKSQLGKGTTFTIQLPLKD